MKFAITEKSSNRKVGPLMVVTSTRETCWSGCPLMRSGCYADAGPLGMLWDNLSGAPAESLAVPHGRGTLRLHTLDGLVAAIRARHRGEGWRYAQAGDLPGRGARIDRKALQRIAKANKAAGARGWTYSHKPVLGNAPVAIANREAIAEAVRLGFVINLSGNNPPHADRLADLGIAPVTVVLPIDAPALSFTPAGRKVVRCPAEGYEAKPIDCRRCMLCSIYHGADAPGGERCIVGFPAHGTSKAKAEAVATG